MDNAVNFHDVRPEKVFMQEEVVKDDVNKQDDDGMTKLMLAAEQKDLKTVLDLLERGVDVNLRDSKGKTELMWAQM